MNDYKLKSPIVVLRTHSVVCTEDFGTILQYLKNEKQPNQFL